MSSLYEVVTVQEAAEEFHVSRHTIIYHIERGNLEWRKTGHVYLICRASLVTLYGNPPKTLHREVHTSLLTP